MRITARTSRRVSLAFVALVAATAALVPASPSDATFSGAFLSYPHQSGRQSITGNDLTIANRSYVGFTAGACLTVHDAHNVYLHDLDFDTCGGGIFLLNVTGTIRIEFIRGRNIGNGSIGSGQGNLIQFNNAWQSAPEIPGGYARVTHIKEYGGDTEDVISVFKSGGIDAAHPLVIGDVHVESPLTGPLAWSSSSGTCANLADAGGHDIRLQNSTFLNCGQVGIQMNQPTRVSAVNNVLYGAQRAGNNVGLSQFGTCSCSGDVMNNNRVWWKNASGGANPRYIQHTSYFSTLYPSPQPMDATIDPNSLHVRL